MPLLLRGSVYEEPFSCRGGYLFFFKQKTAYEMRISDWSSDVCSSDLLTALGRDEIGDELQQLAESITDLLDILSNRAKLYGVIRGELAAIPDEFATPRKPEITAAAAGIEDDDLIDTEDEDVTRNKEGSSKRTPPDNFDANPPNRTGHA